MPANPLSQMERNARLWLQQERKTAELMAAQHTPPPGALPLSREREVQAWWQRDESKDEALLWQAALQKHAEWMAQNPQAAPDDAHKNWTEQMTVVRDLVYPNRAKLLKAGGRAASIEDRVKYAERMAKLGAGEGQDAGAVSDLSGVAGSNSEMGSSGDVPYRPLAAPLSEDPYA